MVESPNPTKSTTTSASSANSGYLDWPLPPGLFYFEILILRNLFRCASNFGCQQEFLQTALQESANSKERYYRIRCSFRQA